LLFHIIHLRWPATRSIWKKSYLKEEFEHGMQLEPRSIGRSPACKKSNLKEEFEHGMQLEPRSIGRIPTLKKSLNTGCN